MLFPYSKCRAGSLFLFDLILHPCNTKARVAFTVFLITEKLVNKSPAIYIKIDHPTMPKLD
jgi:hypothetical protein